MNAGQTIETLQKLVAGNGYEITADCAMTFEPSDQLKPVTDLVQELLNTDSLTAKFTATGDSAQKNLKLQLKENITDKQTSLTTFYLVDGKCYFGIDSIISALAGDVYKRQANILKITAQDLVKLGVAETVIPEPAGGAHNNYGQAAEDVYKRHAWVRGKGCSLPWRKPD